MIFERKDFFTLNYYKKQPYTASCNGTRLRLTLEENEEGKFLQLVTWPEPFAYANTPDEQKVYQQYPYSEEGIVAIIMWLNENLAQMPKE